MAVVGITGHRGLSSDVALFVDREIRTSLAHHGVDLVGVTCLADGADALFARAVVDQGGQLEVIVPARHYRAGLPDAFHPVYDQLIQRAIRVSRLDFEESNSVAHMAASERMLDCVTELLAVWDGQPARGHGGTADIVRAARERGIPVHVIWPDGAVRD